ncbi:MAG: aldehyde dehydrogenase family protein, partial [Candidatus Brocadiia bacterium]
METIPEHGIYVAGRWIRTDRTDPIDNPATGEVFARVTRAEDVHLAEAFRKATDAAPKWADIMVEERAGFLVGAFDLVFEKRHEIARLISQEQGKPFAEAMTLEIIPSLDMLRYYASKAPLFLAPDKTPFHQPWFTAKESRVVFAPLGVVAALTPSFSPWIAPFMSVCLALVAGNAIILKPSDKTPLCGLKVAEIFDELGLPDGLLSVLHGDDAFGAKVADLSVAAVTFIGSRESGAKIATQCCSSFKKSIVGCGGKNPLVVLDDADLDLSAEAAIWGAFANNGQYHANTERVLIHENVADEWVKKAAAHLAKLHIGDPLADDTDLGPMISTEQHQMLDRLIAEATASGARMAARLQIPHGLAANFYSPAILTRVKSSMSIIREPYDGPVMTVETFRDDAEAIALANDTIYG